LSEKVQMRVPISRIARLQAYAEGIQVTWKAAKERSWVLLLNDPWFAANVIAQLIQLARR
jgi:hypothetical protein